MLVLSFYLQIWPFPMCWTWPSINQNVANSKPWLFQQCVHACVRTTGLIPLVRLEKDKFTFLHSIPLPTVVLATLFTLSSQDQSNWRVRSQLRAPHPSTSLLSLCTPTSSQSQSHNRYKKGNWWINECFFCHVLCFFSACCGLLYHCICVHVPLQQTELWVCGSAKVMHYLTLPVSKYDNFFFPGLWIVVFHTHLFVSELRATWRVLALCQLKDKQNNLDQGRALESICLNTTQQALWPFSSVPECGDHLDSPFRPIIEALW